MHRFFVGLLALSLWGGCTAEEVEPTQFEIRIEHIGPAELMGASGPYATMFGPGFASVDVPVFEVGQPANAALERLSETGEPIVYSTEHTPGFFLSNTIGADYTADPLVSGMVRMFQFEARPGDRLTGAMMLVASNDTFLGMDAALFDATGEPIVGPTTIQLYDAGTEVNEELGYGPTQPHQDREAGVDENGVVHLQDGSDGMPYPDGMSLIEVTITLVP